MRKAGQAVAALKATLRAHYETHRVIPSISGLAVLWGFASKSSAAKIVSVMLEDGFLAHAPGRRLRPGLRFAEPELDLRDDVDEAVARWARGYDAAPYRAYDIVARINRLSHSMEMGVERATGKYGITAGELLVLDALYRLGPPFTTSPTALKKHFIISLAGISKRLAGLERKKLIERVADESDGRSQPVRLNDAGRALLERAVMADNTEPHIAWALELTEEEAAFLSRLLRRAQARIDARTSKSLG